LPVTFRDSDTGDEARQLRRSPEERVESYMVVLITVIHVIICAFLIIVVLLQSGQSGDIGCFGGMGSQTAFGTRTAATVLGRATTWAAIASCSPPSRYRYLRRAGPPYWVSAGRHA